MIKQYLNFTYNGINSRDMGCSHVSLNSGLYEENIGGNRTIIEQQNSQSDRRYYRRISIEPIEFEMTIMLNDSIINSQTATVDSVIVWLMQDYYKELYFDNEVDKIYFCMPISNPVFHHDGSGKGYIVLNMRCFDGYIYSSEITKVYDLSSNYAMGTEFYIYNDGHADIYPLMIIEAKEPTIEINNKTTQENTKFTGLLVGEKITLDNENEEITTSVNGVYRFSNHNDVFFRLIPPKNLVNIQGNCIVTLKYRYKRKF
jgi:phage-related protein